MSFIYAFIYVLLVHTTPQFNWGNYGFRAWEVLTSGFKMPLQANFCHLAKKFLARCGLDELVVTSRPFSARI